MAYPVRNYAAHDTWLITNRCFQARKLMTPHTPMVREVTGGVLARAAEKYGVKLYAYAFLSNHFHLVIRAQGPVIADFMQYLLSNLARKLGRLGKRRWWNRFWERRHSAEPILDEEALERSVRYVVAHGVKEGLVARVADWEGLHCVSQLVDGGQPLTFRWYDWTRRWNARRTEGARGDSRWAARFSQPVTLALEPLPRWAALPEAERQRRARALVDDVEGRHAGQPVLGMAAVKQESSAAQVLRKRTPRPGCHAASEAGRDHFRTLRSLFLAAYSAASRAWRAGKTDAEFPLGSFKPFVRCHVRIV